ncbi:guanylate kinase [Deferrisoma camini]|uniref:guanylate kinase n=1 Tax=Deferrisoma camini TaxID=1035120 RepID=UPI00046D4DDD|nr:guanylate kinase [Deferrisoma camini]NOY44222.1 guanylate kinase [Deltaproteobacteria bacterium]
MRQGLVLVISAPSGAGKSTLIRRLREAMPELGYSVSHTTRPPRPGERDGVEYHFVDRATFEAMRDRGEFAEWAEVHGNLYGTALTELRTAAEAGQDLVLDIDVQGALQVAQRLPHAVLVFVLPPSWEELERRLKARGQDDPEVIARRLANARQEVAEAPRYHYVVVNDDMGRCLEDLKAVVRAERCRPVRQQAALAALLGGD